MVLNGYTKTNCCQEVTWRPHHWELLENPISFDKLVASLIGEHDVTVEICRREVATFIAALRERELLAV